MSIRCPACLLQRTVCVCGDAPRVVNRVPVTIVRHHYEVNRPSSTSRHAALAVQNLRLLPYGDPTVRFDPSLLELPGAVLVFPGGPSELPVRPGHLILVDGSWPQARHMVQRIPSLRGVPRLSLTAPSRLRIRNPPPGGMSTLEAVAYALAAAGEPEHCEPLLAFYDLITARTRATAKRHRAL